MICITRNIVVDIRAEDRDRLPLPMHLNVVAINDFSGSAASRETVRIPQKRKVSSCASVKSGTLSGNAASALAASPRGTNRRGTPPLSSLARHTAVCTFALTVTDETMSTERIRCRIFLPSIAGRSEQFLRPLHIYNANEDPVDAAFFDSRRECTSAHQQDLPSSCLVGPRSRARVFRTRNEEKTSRFPDSYDWIRLARSIQAG
jgi:hypothetical protein